MKQRHPSESWLVVRNWRQALIVALLICAWTEAALADGTGSLVTSWVNGRSFQPGHRQPVHPFIPNR